MSAPVDVPDVPKGTLLRLTAGEWRGGRGLPRTVEAEVIVEMVHGHLGHRTGDARWVLGHLPECANARSKDQHPPCVEVLVEIAALRRAVGQ